MPSHCSGNMFFINEFDESMDTLYLEFVEQIKYQANSKKAVEKRKVELYINSEGGDSYRALALVELMEWAKHLGCSVETYVLHEADSSGSMVAVAGSPGKRFVSVNGVYLLHWGSVDTVSVGPVEAKQNYEHAVRHFDAIEDLYARYTNISDIRLRLNMGDSYIDASQAIDWGLADGYIH